MCAAYHRKGYAAAGETASRGDSAGLFKYLDHECSRACYG